MVILGIDPGSRRCGFGVVSRAGPRLTRLASGVLAPREASTPERLGAILEGLGRILEAGGIDAVAVETVFLGLSPRSALALGQARGVALAAAGRAGLPVHEFAPAEVKRAFTGHGRAEKAQMVRTARALFGVEARYADEADALAVAVCCLASLGAGRSGRSGGCAATVCKARASEAAARLRPAVRRFGA